MVEFFECEISADAYKARLLMDILGVERTSRLVEVYPAGEDRAPWFLELSPRGELPVLRDGALIVDGALASLIHLARTYDGSGRWYPEDDPALAAEVARWLTFDLSLAATAGAARLHDGILAFEIDADACRRDAHALLRDLDEHLWFNEQAGEPWLCRAGHPTIADIACFPDVALAEEGAVLLHEYPAIRRWMDRVKGIPGFTVMPGIFPL